MPNITLPDGSVKKYNKTVTIAEVAKDIGEGLARAALAGKIQDQLVDLSYEIIEDTSLSIITSKSPESLDILRHSAAHLLAHAVKNIFPEAQVTIGPVVEDGFYYDFSYKRPFTPDDIARIEKKMNELSKENIGINRKVIQRQAAIDYFKSIGEIYKSEIISSIPEGEELSLYEQGDFTDLCRG
ncbi:MAG: TGS domain-containing protein, partial [Nitrosomonadales bacterium]|nr:TGS domain-containing protein [Nitrosomonadales bacterium]